MFTGIIEELGEVASLDHLDDAMRLTVRGPQVTADVRAGDSIAVNGCCLTVARRQGAIFAADVMRETLDRTSLGGLKPGARVNLERAVTATTRLGGHMVQGHVDGTGMLIARRPSQHWEVLEIAMQPRLERYLVEKGSITVDGVSLTVVSVTAAGPEGFGRAGHEASFTVSLIPETLSRTTLGLKQLGETVNLEVDVIAKYVERLLTYPTATRNRKDPT